MKKTLSIILLTLIIALTGCSGKSLKKNIGVANMTTTINNGEVSSPSIDEIVPEIDNLIENLEEKSYTIEKLTQVTEEDIAVNRVYATKKNSFIDICYELNSDDTRAVFDYFESIYKDYYILAVNGDYVYCISDKRTFSSAGFKSLANNGIQYIYE